MGIIGFVLLTTVPLAVAQDPPHQDVADEVAAQVGGIVVTARQVVAFAAVAQAAASLNTARPMAELDWAAWRTLAIHRRLLIDEVGRADPAVTEVRPPPPTRPPDAQALAFRGASLEDFHRYRQERTWLRCHFARRAALYTGRWAGGDAETPSMPADGPLPESVPTSTANPPSEASPSGEIPSGQQGPEARCDAFPFWRQPDFVRYLLGVTRDLEDRAGGWRVGYAPDVATLNRLAPLLFE